jgi:adenine-specific DNA-methyltransferase
VPEARLFANTTPKLAGGGLGAAVTANAVATVESLTGIARDPDEIRDGYQLRFIGKDYAKLQTGLKTETVLVPDAAHNAKPENAASGNVFITGDNLDCLKHLENAYTGKVDVIYIDPPYNTGSDGFVYADNFKFTDEQLKEKLGLTDAEVARVRALTGKSSHSAWLTFMYPRLVIAKRLLKDTGVIFVSIDDNEQANLKLLMDTEVFYENNFVSQLICWQDKYTTTNDKVGISSQIDYVLAYSKKTDEFMPNKLPLREEYVKSTYTNDDDDGKGKYRLVQMYKKKNQNSFDVVSPTGKVWNMPWNFTKENFERMNNEDRIYWGKDGNAQPQKKVYLSESTGINPINLLLLGQNVGFSGDGGEEIENLFSNRNIFSYPKPSSLIKHLLKIGGQKDSLILDFFAGSGTTADAVMQLNKEDGGNRKWILCTLDEPCNPASEAARAGYGTIDEISRERIKRAAQKILECGDLSPLYAKRPAVAATPNNTNKDLFPTEMPPVVDGEELDLSESGENSPHSRNVAAGGAERAGHPRSMDLGFKSFFLKKPSIATLDKIEEFVPGEKLFDDMLTPFSAKELGIAATTQTESNRDKATGTDTLLATWLVDDGFTFDEPVKPLTFGENNSPAETATAYHVARRLYILDTNWDTAATKALLNAIGTNALSVQTLIVYAYSLRFEVLTELKTNLKTNLDADHKVELIERF